MIGDRRGGVGRCSLQKNSAEASEDADCRKVLQSFQGAVLDCV